MCLPLFAINERIRKRLLTAGGLTAKRFINLRGVKSHNYGFIDNNDRSRHVSKSFEVDQGAWVLRDILLLKLYSLLRKILLRLVAEHSAVLRIDDDALHLFSPWIGLVPLARKR